jgi:hypothetical protein
MSKRTEREEQLVRAAKGAAYGEALPYAEPNEPTAVEALCLRAIEAFKSGAQCRGWDLVEQAEGIES